VTPVERVTIADSTEYVGRTESVSSVDLRARVTGLLMHRNFEEGSDVREGDLLYVIEREPYQAAVDAAGGAVAEAEAALRNAEKYLKRIDAVRGSGATSQADIDAAERTALVASAILNQRRAHLTEARLDLSYTEIRAPISGRIGRTAIHVGNLVGPESGVLATIVKLDPIWVSFPISERDYLELQEEGGAGEHGSKGPAHMVPTIRLVDGSAYPHKGTLDFQDNRMDRATGTLMVRATFPNPQLLLRPGQFVTVTQTEDRSTENLVIPQAAVQRDQVGPFVLLVNQEKKAEVRRVQLGKEFGTKWVVSTGLSEGELVISDGIQKVIVGSPVNPFPASSTDDNEVQASAE
jgi:membrane fusion protein (multidrug efflux system)